MEQTFFIWLENHMPVIAFFACITAFAVWVTTWIVEHQNRIKRLEEDSNGLKKDVKSLKRSVARIDQKVDRLIAYLTAAKTIDFKD